MDKQQQLSLVEQWKCFWQPVITEVLTVQRFSKSRVAKASLSMPNNKNLKEGSTHNLAWTKCLLSAIEGKKVLRQAMDEHAKLYGKEKGTEGPKFDGQDNTRVYGRVCAELDVSSAWPSCVLALEPEEGDKCIHDSLLIIQRIMKGFVDLRDRASKRGDRVLAKGFKGAANTFLGCMKHVFPRIQNRYVSRLKDEMSLACKVIQDDPGLEYIAMVSDSVIYTSASGEAELTDERITGVLNAVNEICTCCTFEPERKYSSFIYLKKNVQFGLVAVEAEVFERGIIGRLQTAEAVEYLHDLIRYMTKAAAADTVEVATMPYPERAYEALERLPQNAYGDRERSDFSEKRNKLLRFMHDLGVGSSGRGAMGTATMQKKYKKHTKRKRDSDEGECSNQEESNLIQEVRNLAKRWGVQLGVF